MAKHSNLLSRLLQLTALIFFIYALYRLYRYFTNWLLPSEYMIYAIFAAIVMGVGILIFDDVFKPGKDFVGWAFLTGLGFLSLITGILFIFFPYFPAPTSLIAGPFWTRAVFFMIMGLIIIIESLLIRREVVPGEHGVTSDTIGPLLLKFTAIFTLAWGSYQMSWVLVPFLRNVPITSMLPLFLSALGNVLVGLILIIYVENQKRQPLFRLRRLPLFLSFLLVLMILPLTAFYISIYFVNTLLFEILFNAIVGLALGLTFLVISFYIVYHPTKAR
ncbi:MAG: hypothetical protein ACFFDJ_04010 [Candidatus Odinarchaeota archaeon]